MPDPGLEARRSASTRGRQRAVELADGFIFGGAARPSTIAPAIQSMRPRTTEAGKTDLSFNTVAYIAHGPIEHIKEVLAEYAACGLCLLVPLPEVRSLRQLDLLSEQVLPSPSTGPDANPAGGKPTGAYHPYAPCSGGAGPQRRRLATRSVADERRAMATATLVRELPGGSLASFRIAHE